jgi:ribosome-associated protein
VIEAKTTMTSNFNSTNKDDDGEVNYEPSKSQVKRECQHLLDVGDEILKLKLEEIHSLDLPVELEEAISTALKIKSRSGLKRQRQYIGKLLRSIDSETIEAQLKIIQHRHDTNTAQFKRLEKWRDKLIDNDKTVLNEVITRFPEIDRQYINQLIRAAHQEKKRNKPPAAARKLFKYLSELEDDRDK